MFVSAFIKKESQYFQKLTKNGQYLISSIIIFNIAGPILGTFINAFLWRHSLNVTIVATYTLVTWLLSPVGFYLNGLLLKRVPIGKIFSLVTIATGVIVSLLIFFQPSGLLPIIAFGLLNGLATGFYYSNRNYLTLKSVDQGKRVYFYSLEGSSATIAGIFIPPIIGWFIILGQQVNLYSIQTAYLLLGFISLIILYVAGSKSGKIEEKVTDLNKILLKEPTKNWSRMRALMFYVGIFNGVEMFLPSIIILMLVGNEAVLGTVQGAIAIFSTVLLYIVGRKQSHNLLQILLWSTIFSLISSVFLGAFFTAIGVLIYLTLSSIGLALRWLSILPLFYNTIAADQNYGKNHHFAYIFDTEVVLNLGRGLGISLFIIAFFAFGQLAIQWVIPIYSLFQIPVLYFAHKISVESK